MQAVATLLSFGLQVEVWLRVLKTSLYPFAIAVLPFSAVGYLLDADSVAAAAEAEPLEGNAELSWDFVAADAMALALEETIC